MSLQKPFGLDFIWKDGRLMVADVQLAKVCGYKGTRDLNLRLRRYWNGDVVKASGVEALMLHNSIARPGRGGNRKGNILYDAEMMDCIAARRTSALTSKDMCAKIRCFCALFKLFDRKVEKGRLIATHMGARNNNNNAANAIREKRAGKGSSCSPDDFEATSNREISPEIDATRYLPRQLVADHMNGRSHPVRDIPHGKVVTNDGPVSYSISIDTVRLVFRCAFDSFRHSAVQSAYIEFLEREGARAARGNRPHGLNYSLHQMYYSMWASKGWTYCGISINPSKIILPAAFSPLMLSFEAGGVTDFQWDLTRLDFAVDYPCAMGIPLLFDDAIDAEAASRRGLSSGRKLAGVIGKGPHRSLYMPLRGVTACIYDKTRQLGKPYGRKQKESPHRIENYENKDIWRFEIRFMRSSQARRSFLRNSLAEIPFPNVFISEARASIPHPWEIYKKWNAVLREEFIMNVEKTVGKLCGMEAKQAPVTEASVTPLRERELGRDNRRQRR